MRSNQGFTLVELLVSMALLSVMAIYAIQAFGTLLSMNRVEVEIAAQMEVDAAARHLRNELEGTSTVFMPDARATPKLLFAGAASTVSYVAHSNGEREVGGLYWVNLALDPDGSLKSKRQLIQAKISEHVNEVVLLRNVQTIQFTYLDHSNPRIASNEWSEANQLPIAIEINLTFAAQDKRQWPKTVVRLQNVE